jgi:hypothetical protein
MVQSQILKAIPDPTEVVVHGYNLIASFILLPIFFLGWAMLFGNIPYAYDWTYSFVAYASTVLAL